MVEPFPYILYALVKKEAYIMDVSAGEVRENMASLLNRVAYGGERIFVTRRGKRVAALVPVEDLEAMQRTQDEAHGEETPRAARVRALIGRFAEVSTSSEAFSQRKQAEIEREG
jgi:prevent-host-death family protein